MRCGSQDSQLILKDPQLASVIPPNRPGLVYVRIRQHTGYMQSYFIPDPRLISMVRGSRPRLTSAAPWTLHISREEPEAIMGVEELFQLAEGEQEGTRPRQLDPTNPQLRQRVLELWRSTKQDGTPYSQRDIEGIVTGEFCQESYKGGQAFKIVKEIINGAAIPA